MRIAKQISNIPVILNWGQTIGNFLGFGIEIILFGIFFIIANFSCSYLCFLFFGPHSSVPIIESGLNRYSRFQPMRKSKAKEYGKCLTTVVENGYKVHKMEYYLLSSKAIDFHKNRFVIFVHGAPLKNNLPNVSVLTKIKK